MSAVLAPPDVVGGRFVLDMDEEEYHRHHALSSSGMKVLLRSPKHYHMDRSKNKAKPEFDIGHAVHARVLGVGKTAVEIPGKYLSADGGIRSNAAKAWVEEARAAGNVPLKPVVFEQVRRAADAVLNHPKARTLLEQDGFSEASLFFEDPVTGVELRARLDRLAGTLPIDVKSTTDVRRRNIERVVVDFGYDVQAFVYRLALKTVLGIDPEPMHLIFTEKEPPYEVRVVRLADPAWAEGGERKARAAIDLFAWCTETHQWPGDDEVGPIEDLPAPRYYMSAVEEVTL